MNKPLVSYRAWRLTVDWKAKAKKNRLLYPVFIGLEEKSYNLLSDMWQPGKLTKRDDKNHGIYSWKNEINTLEYMISEMRWENLLDKDICFGEMHSWGKIEEFELGYQSEYAYPKKLYILNDAILGQKFRRLYGCEIENIQAERWLDILLNKRKLLIK